MPVEASVIRMLILLSYDSVEFDNILATQSHESESSVSDGPFGRASIVRHTRDAIVRQSIHILIQDHCVVHTFRQWIMPHVRDFDVYPADSDRMCAPISAFLPIPDSHDLYPVRSGYKKQCC